MPRTDLLASEARLASFVAIAAGDVPQAHWFRLGRLAVSVDGVPTLLSWSATMFEYLMPSLLMRSFPDTLLDQTSRRVVRRQIQYGRRAVPWGISESAYGVVDRQGTYQYRRLASPAGPEAGPGRGSGGRSIRHRPGASREPDRRRGEPRSLARAGGEGPLGYYDAIDYTPRKTYESDESAQTSAPPQGVVVRTYMAHHHGMTLVALANALLADVMVARFHGESRVKATELLLQERVPREAAAEPPRPAEESRRALVAPMSRLRRFRSPHTSYPHAQFLSNGSYSRRSPTPAAAPSWRGLSVTRWRGMDPDPGGLLLYLRDVRCGGYGQRRINRLPGAAKTTLVTFLTESAVFNAATTTSSLSSRSRVSPEDDVKYGVSRSPTAASEREMEITSYGEIVLGPPIDDLPTRPSASCSWRPRTWRPVPLSCAGAARGARRRPPRPSHAELSMAGPTVAFEWETDRGRFLAGAATRRPIALDGRPLSVTTGTVFDPIVSLRHRLRLRPGDSRVSLRHWRLVVARRRATRAEVQRLGPAARAFSIAYTHGQMVFRHLGVSSEDAQLIDRLASRVLYVDGRCGRRCRCAQQLGSGGPVGSWRSRAICRSCW